MWLPHLEIGAAQIRSVTEIAPTQPFLCMNRSPIRYGFRGGAKAFQYSVNKASASLPQCNLAKRHWEQLLSVLKNLPYFLDIHMSSFQDMLQNHYTQSHP